ncbi:Cof-type HAD-IIB family hydrolase [Paenibacillus sacheonensis]|uniref:HAD-IIB family hydrolase n=1 Tax=Paenibacillus sacheonensis TaxID=742054 RepID=A0A7X4YQM7_9BACL|nr:Cof-type HAD-IIB family hydrolase [Paenibacillus sacheonensis]MBM7567423.1 HAD superfamily hydrolase (TIGR01484 family) [Paenibacillus sacheonensis]NBC69794.1 HAD-IIB family hydrolase [Paenibacillus sacheonensis]
MGSIKLVALDMDGTLLNDRQEVSKENAKWIRKALDAGIIVSFATGRGYDSALPYAEQLGLETPMITVNGGEIWTRPQVLHQRTLMSVSVVERLHEVALRYPECWYWAYTTMGVYNKENWSKIAGDLSAQHWLKFGYYTEDKPMLEAILKETSSWGGLEITNSSSSNLEMNPEGVSKASALRELCSVLGIEMSEVAAMGDSLNDIAMIREAGLGVAMGNAQDEVKAAADVVGVSNEEDAVAYLIQNHILKG